MGMSDGRTRIQEQGVVNIEKEYQQESEYYQKAHTNVVLEGSTSSPGIGKLAKSDNKQWEQNKNIEERNNEQIKKPEILRPKPKNPKIKPKIQKPKH